MRFTKQRKKEGMPQAVRVLFTLDVMLLTVYLIDSLTGAPMGRHVSSLIGLGTERNIPTLYSSMKLVAIGSLFLIKMPPKDTIGSLSRLAIALLGLIFIAMSLDEILRIHEFIGHASDRVLLGSDRSSSIFPVTGIWMFLLVPPVFVLMWISIFKLHRDRLIGDEYDLFLKGLVIFFVSAGGIEVFANYTNDGATALIQVSAEEFGELIGLTVMFWAVHKSKFVPPAC